MALPIFGAATLGFLGYWAGKSWEENSEISETHEAIGGALLGILVGGMIGLVASPSTLHVIECP